MTLREVINMVNALKPNQYTDAQKVQWLSECDSTIFREIIDTHERPEGMPEVFLGYDPDRDMDRKLLAPAPHDMLYRYYLEAQIDLYNKELNNYNNTSRTYNVAYAAFAAWYNTTYMPRRYATHYRL